ncbi:DUF6274 family protein [Streptomyces brevispora]|uniref:DUF6274 family protein n=1 Tax=Streptomyces brevispora TaxID=887462 RepID=UPI0039A7244A
MAASTDEGFRTGELFRADEGGTREPVRPRAGRRAPRHEIRALLRAHLAAATGYRHLTRHCAVCARLLRLAMEPVAASAAVGATEEPSGPPGPPTGPTGPWEAPVRAQAPPLGGTPPPGAPGAVRDGRRAQDESPSAT